MHTASSAKRTCSASVSTVLWTATVWRPSSRHARITRSAISPRFAMRTFWSFFFSLAKGRSALADAEERIAVLDRLAVRRDDLDDRAGDLGLDLVHELHRLDDAEHRAGTDLA